MITDVIEKKKLHSTSTDTRFNFYMVRYEMMKRATILYVRGDVKVTIVKYYQTVLMVFAITIPPACLFVLNHLWMLPCYVLLLLIH